MQKICLIGFWIGREVETGVQNINHILNGIVALLLVQREIMTL
jgi:putative Mn2+ efflux pump MntP